MNCVNCGAPLPKNQGSKLCSMCYGDVDHGKDGYYQQEREAHERREQEERDREPGS